MPSDFDDTVTTQDPAPGHIRRTALRHLADLLRTASKPWWATPTLVALGIAASLAETIGITLIVLFFYTAIGQVADDATVGGMLGSALQYLSSWLTSPVQLAAVILVMIIARGALAFANHIISAHVSETISERARNLVHDQYLMVSYGFVQRYEQAQLMEILDTESWLIADAYGSLTGIAIGLCSICVFALFLFALSWQITLIALVGSLLISTGLRQLSRPARRLGARVKRVHQQLGEQMLTTLEGLRTIRIYGQEQVQQMRFVRLSAEARGASLALTRLTAVLSPLTEVGYLGILCVIIAGSGYWDASVATTLAAVALLYRLQPYSREIEGHLLYLAQIEPQLRSVLTMLRKDDKVYPPAGHRPMRSMQKGIRFAQVTFRYDEGSIPALRNVSFEIPAGVTTAMVGPSGAGKTTLINLLLRLYQPSSGAITVDDVPLDEIRRSDWLQMLAVAGQDVDLIEGTVIDNIRMANNNATRDAIVSAARLAGVAEFVESLPEGYDTWIGQQGLRFSGGERQRIGLARAVLRDPQLLILDEATSSLDRDLESRIRRAIDERFAGRTILIISHRHETVRDADRVVTIDDGVIVSETTRQRAEQRAG